VCVTLAERAVEQVQRWWVGGVAEVEQVHVPGPLGWDAGECERGQLASGVEHHPAHARTDRLDGHVQQQRALAAPGRAEHVRVLQQPRRLNADLAVKPRVIAMAEEKTVRGCVRGGRDPARRRLAE
jgi:hypothetical protein